MILYFITIHSIVKRDKYSRRTRGITPVRGIRMRERAYNFSAHFRVGRGTRAVLYYADTID
jgi:hypothetical protein